MVYFFYLQFFYIFIIFLFLLFLLFIIFLFLLFILILFMQVYVSSGSCWSAYATTYVIRVSRATVVSGGVHHQWVTIVRTACNIFGLLGMLWKSYLLARLFRLHFGKKTFIRKTRLKSFLKVQAAKEILLLYMLL